MDELNRRRAVVYTHPTTANCCGNLIPDVPESIIEWGTDTSRTIASIVFSGTAARCPDMKIIFSHGGGTMPFLTERYTRLPLVNKNLAARVPNGVEHELKRFYYDTAQAAHPMALASLTKLVPASQIVFGTDFPYRTAADHVKGLAAYGFSASDLQAIERGQRGGADTAAEGVARPGSDRRRADADILRARPAMVERTIEYFSYGGLLLILLLGSLGLPIPEEVPIVTAGSPLHQQVMRWWLAVPTCIAGVLIGDLVLYGAGCHWGERVLEMRLLGRLLNRARLDQIEASYRRRGVLIVFLARNVMGLRAAAFIGAGVVGVPFRKFLAADGAAIAYGVPLNFGIAYFFASHLKAVFEEVHRIERWIALVALVAADLLDARPDVPHALARGHHRDVGARADLVRGLQVRGGQQGAVGNEFQMPLDQVRLLDPGEIHAAHGIGIGPVQGFSLEGMMTVCAPARNIMRTATATPVRKRDVSDALRAYCSTGFPWGSRVMQLASDGVSTSMTPNPADWLNWTSWS